MEGKGSIPWLGCASRNLLGIHPPRCVFVFRSRSGAAIRLPSYDGQGYWLAQKRLSKGRFVWWPGVYKRTRSPMMQR
jgi:transposase